MKPVRAGHGKRPSSGGSERDPEQEFTPDELSLIGKSVGNYVIERPLARGGMAIVFVARHPELGRAVAVKFLNAEFRLDLDLNQRFLQEAKVTAALRHPGIIEIHDYGKLEGRTYYVMELLGGVDLAAVMARRRRFSCQEVVEYGVQICEALEAAHQGGVIHRDLKPSNVFVVREESLQLKLMDFGIAKLRDNSRGSGTLRGQILGTPSHMSPEQALGQTDRVGVPSDLYSLGVIAYEMLSGSLPFNHESDVMLIAMHVRDPLPSLRERAPGIPERLVELVERCLAKDPRDRPQSARELAQALRAAIAPEPGAGAVSVSGGGSAGDRAVESGVATPFGDAERAVPADGLQSGKGGARALPPRESNLPRAALSGAGSGVWVATSGKIEGPQAPHGPLLSEITDGPRSTDGRVTLSRADAEVLDRVLRRMQRRADFPAFLSNVTEISRKADADGQYSADQLSQAILKDFALTAKLLRLVNTMYASRFGGKVFSVNQAVVILGFDSVRAIALGVSIFKSPGQARGGPKSSKPGLFDQQLAESAINSLTSGEVARLLATKAGLDDPELAMMCAVFRNLGQHLVMQYLPEEYGKILALARARSVSLAEASAEVLGTSLPKLGLGVAERWLLPKKMQIAVSTSPAPGQRLEREVERLSALAQLSNDLCHIVATADRSHWSRALDNLLSKYRNLLTLEGKEVTALLGAVCKSFEARHAALFGSYARRSRFLKNARELSGETEPPVPEAAGPLSEAGTARLGACVADLTERLRARRDVSTLLTEALELLGSVWRLPRVVVLVLSPDWQTLKVRAAIGEDADALVSQFELPVTRGVDVFSTAARGGKQAVVTDALEPSAMRRVPQRYFEMLGSAAFGIYPCISRGTRTALVLVDTDNAECLPTSERLKATKSLRELLAVLAERE